MSNDRHDEEYEPQAIGRCYSQEELDQAVQAFKLDVNIAIKEKMDMYDGLAKWNALDAIKGNEDNRADNEKSAMTSYNVFTGLDMAYDIIRFQW